MTFKSIMALHAGPMSPEPTGLSPGGGLKPPVRAVLFDIYGTLLISASGDIHMTRHQSRPNDRLEKLLKKYDIRYAVPELIGSYLDAVASAHALMRKQDIDVPEIQVDQIWMQVLNSQDIETVRRFAAEFEIIANPVWPMPHAVETLDVLRQKGIIIGIISNAQFYTAHLFDLFFDKFPDELGFERTLIFYSFVLGRAKPSLALFENAVDRIRIMGIDPGHVAYIGNDIRNDILPARTVGFQTILFAGDRRSLRLRKNDPGCVDIAPDLIITDLAQLPEYVC